MSGETPDNIVHADFRGEDKLGVFQRRFVALKNEIRFGYITTLSGIHGKLKAIDTVLPSFEHEDHFLKLFHFYEADQAMPNPKSATEYSPEQVQRFAAYALFLREWEDAINGFLASHETWHAAAERLLNETQQVPGSQELQTAIQTEIARIAIRASDFQQVIARHMPSRSNAIENLARYISRVTPETR